MIAWNREYVISWEKQEKKSIVLPKLHTYILAVLLMTPSLQIKSEDWGISQQQNTIESYQDKELSTESLETMVSYEDIFKDGIRRALHGVNDIHQIPVWGKHIDYYRDGWTTKWKKIKKESIQNLRLPETFDISPRDITKPISSMVFHLGNRKFDISPIIGKINAIYLTPESLVIETTLLDIIYKKQDKLPDLMFRLRMTPTSKWEKKWFKGTTVVEL
jgi:hypothetical protein